MSSKSKYTPPAQKKSARPPGRTQPGAAVGSAPEEKGILSEDVIQVPRGMKRWQFVLLIALVILLLIIFLVPGEIGNIFGGGAARQNPVFLRWERPGHGTVELTLADFQNEIRALEAALRLDPLAGFGLGAFSGGSLEGPDVARLLVLDQLAADAGLVITDADLAEHLQQYLQFTRSTPEIFRAQVRQYRMSQAFAENTIRRLLRIGRYLQMVGFASAIPDPQEIERQFHQENVEFAFEYARLPIESLHEEARAGLPDDAALESWFQALSEPEKQPFEEPEKRKAQFVFFRGLEAATAEALLAAHPEVPAEGSEPSTPEQLAQQYYNRVFHRRFMAEGAEPEEGAQPQPPRPRSFEEVREQCLAEAPVYFAMQRWLDDLKARKTNNEEIDLAAEAARFGLEERTLSEPLSREELAAPEGIGDRELADAVFSATPDGSFYYSVIAQPDALVLARALERVAPVLPPFAEIRERVAEKWLQPRAEELALERLEALRQGFESFTPEPEPDQPAPPATGQEHRRASAEAFRAAVEGAGLEFGRRDWLNRSGPAEDDPQRESPAHRFIASQFQLYQLADDEVAEPALSRDKEAAYLVRKAGERELPIERMTPAQFQRYQQNAGMGVASELAEQLDYAFLERNYGLWMPREEEPEEPEDAGAASGGSERDG
jgi:parvulin-like peptidyl-prolyl isomerase